METYLAHHGILGMKWGIRRYQTDDGTLTAAGKVRYGRKMTAKRKAAAKKAAQAKKKNAEAKRKEEARQAKEEVKRTADERAGKPRDVSTMSDQEIKDFLARKELESKYLAAVTPQQTQKGESAVQKYLSKFGDSLASNLATGAAQRIANKILDSVFDDGKQNNTRGNPGGDNSSSKKKTKENKTTEPKVPKAPETEKKPKESKESIFDTIKKEKAKRETRAESATKEKVFTGTVEGGRKYTEEHKTKWENKTIIDVDPIPYQRAETFVRALPSYNMNVLALPPAWDDD